MANQKIYDSLKQPVSYAVVYGIVPELRDLLKPSGPNLFKNSKLMKQYENGK